MNSTATNPFSSRQLRPGAIPFIFPVGQTIDGLLDRLRSRHWRGQIIGPHGSGKSTLVQALLPKLQECGMAVTLGTFQGGNQRWTTHAPIQAGPPSNLSAPESEGVRTIVIIDGFEQLSWATRARWKLICWVKRQGLLVTAHRNMGLPELHDTETSAELAQQVVAELLRGTDCELTQSEIINAFQSHDHNMRDTLFALYDLYETRSRRAATS